MFSLEIILAHVSRFWNITMPSRRHTYRRRVIYPMWLKELVRTWRQQGVTLRQIQARFAEIGFNISIVTMATWCSSHFVTHNNTA